MVLLPLNLAHSDDREVTARKALRKLYALLQPRFSLNIYVGGIFDGLDGLQRSYLSAQAMQETALRQSSRNRSCSIKTIF